MTDNICICRREKEIDELKERVKYLEDFQRSDHDLLVRLDVKLDNMNSVLETLVEKVESLMNKPADRYEKLKIAITVTAVTAIITYVINLVLI
jgi:hypothetical protein